MPQTTGPNELHQNSRPLNFCLLPSRSRTLMRYLEHLPFLLTRSNNYDVIIQWPSVVIRGLSLQTRSQQKTGLASAVVSYTVVSVP